MASLAEWLPSLDTQQKIDNFMQALLAKLPYLLGIDEIVGGCTIIAMDPFAVGTFPRQITVALRGDYHQFVMYRGGLGVGVGDEVTVVHLRDGDRYEVLMVGGSTGTPSFLDPTARGQILYGDATPAWALRNIGASASVLYSDGTDPQWGNGFQPTWTARHDFNLGIRFSNAVIENEIIFPLNMDEALRFVDWTTGFQFLTFDSNAPLRVVLNYNRADIDVDIHGDTNPYLFHADASLERVSLMHMNPDRIWHPLISDAVTAAVSYIARITHQSTGTPAAGFGVGYEFELEDAGGTDIVAAMLEAIWTDAAAVSRQSRLQIRTKYIGTDVLSVVIESPETASPDGNARGTGAVDLQGYRSGVAQVASGEYAVLPGGAENIASGDYASTPGGAEAQADKYGQHAHASGAFANEGDAQGTIQFCLRRQVDHLDVNWYELYLDGSGASQRMTLSSDTVWTFEALIVGTTSGCTKSFGFKIQGIIENDGGTTTLLASTVTTIYDADDVSFDARASADDPNDALLIEVQDSGGGIYGDTVRWVATVRTAEVTYA